MSTAVKVTTLDGDSVNITTRALEALSASIDGAVLRPVDAGFDEAVRIWNGMISKRPAIVVQPVTVRDVQQCVLFARANGLLLSIKSGGHNVAGTSLADGGLTLDMSRMRTVTVDSDRRRAQVGAGCLLGDVDRATQEHGLATVLGAVSETGVAGLTLGGGFGYLTRRFGWTVDNLEEAQVITADGEVRRAAGDEHDDLFWALRGGGGNFGVVTRLTFRLHEVGPEITGGLILWDADQADDVLARYREVTETAPRDMTLFLVTRRAPAVPFIPERWHGKPTIGILACHTGDPATAARDLAPIRAVGTPIADVIVRKPYVEQQSIVDASWPKGMHHYWKSEFLPRLSNELLDTYRQHAAEITSPASQAILFQLGGAAADQDSAATSFGNRDAAYVFFGAACWAPDAPDPERHVAWARSGSEAIRPYSTGGSYINVQTEDEGESRIRDAYQDNLDRLAKVKDVYDPDNLFRVNRNITPAARPATSAKQRRAVTR
jgi:FAD/FMN-containing dehydrogenase